MASYHEDQDVAEDFEIEENEEDIKDTLKACIIAHGGMTHPKWILPLEEMGVSADAIVAEMRDYLGMESIELLDLNTSVPKAIPKTPNAKERIDLSIENAMKVSNIAFKTGYTYTGEKELWNKETRERTQKEFMGAAKFDKN